MAVKDDVKNAGEGKKKALSTAMGQIEKKFGKGSIMKLGENADMSISAIPTGSIALDFALGVGGVPRGRIVEIYGPESSGKTTVALHIVAEAQKMGGTAAFIDAEHALDPVYAKALGVNVDELLVSQPDYGEQALEIADELMRSDALDVLVIDSVAALVPKVIVDGEMGMSTMGVQARMMSQALGKLAAVVAKSKCVLIFINQLREKVGVVYGNPEVTTGGRALRFYTTVRIDVRRGEQLKNKTEIVGNHIKCKVAKNKVAPPFKTAEFDILYGVGICRESELLDMGVALGVIEKSGSWFSYAGDRIGQGRDNARLFLQQNPQMASDIEKKIRAAASENFGEGLSYDGTQEQSTASFAAPVADDDELDLDDLD
ncbi:MAG: recombinase RecA [Clostridia bacterium]|nr:recombinase RecA [Clostridia bacterium]